MRYTVDWTDPSYPCVVECDGILGVSFAQAKRDLIRSARELALHWRAVVRNARSLKNPARKP